MAPAAVNLVSTPPQREAVPVTPIIAENAVTEMPESFAASTHQEPVAALLPVDDLAFDTRRAGMAVLLSIVAAGIIVGTSRTLIGCFQIHGLTRRATSATDSVETAFSKVVSV